MQATQTLIIGVIAVLIGVVLIGPVTSTVSRLTTQGQCATSGTFKALDGSTDITAAPANTVVPYRVFHGSPRVAYERGTLCANNATNADALSDGETLGADARFYYAIAGKPGGLTAGGLGYNFASSRALAILIPLLFVAAIMVVPMYLIWGKLRTA